MSRFRPFALVPTFYSQVAPAAPFRNACSAAVPALLAGSALLALTGCAAIQVHLGMKVYLAKTPVTSIEATQPCWYR